MVQLGPGIRPVAALGSAGVVDGGQGDPLGLGEQSRRPPEVQGQRALAPRRAALVVCRPLSNARAKPTSRAADAPSEVVAFANQAAVPLIPAPSPTPAASTVATAVSRTASNRRARRSMAFTSSPVTTAVGASRHACRAITASTAVQIRPGIVNGDPAPASTAPRTVTRTLLEPLFDINQ